MLSFFNWLYELFRRLFCGYKVEYFDLIEDIRDVLAENGVQNAAVRVTDRGALECVIRARVETALLRGKE